MEKIVEIKGLCKKFGKTEVLHDVSFDIYEDEIVGFIGPNGAGKSTTMKCMCNLIFPSAGTIKICGYDIVKEREKALNEILSQNTGQSLKKIEKDTDRDYIMTPEEALEYGMIDKIISKDSV